MFPIARMYDSEARAREAAAALAAAEISDDWITVITPGPDAAAALESGAASGLVPRTQMAPLSRGLEAGHTVVSAAGPLSFGVLIESTLEGFGAVGTDSLNPYGDSGGALLSDLLGIPTLTDNSRGSSTALSSGSSNTKLASSDFAPTSFIPLLTDGKAIFGGLTSSDFSISKMLGLPLLTKNSK